ncbi:MAG: hypothetical protein JNK27_13255 [Chitinophagaceae bacterium]|nr:hypothetical protein [Chitinophagaceae bacterium]
MKKTLTLFSSLLIFAGVKAQTTPTVKKETVKPVVTIPATTDTAKVVKPGTKIKQTSKAIKFDHIKKTNTVQMKENVPTVTKPHKD